MHRSRLLLLLVALCILAHVSAYAQATSDVLLQGFYWNVHPGDSAQATSKGVWWDTLATVANDVAGAGIQMVWFPQPGKSFAGVQDMGYGPYDYFDLGNLNQKGTTRTRFGTRAELEAALSTLHSAGLQAMVDIVAGHRAGADFAPWNTSFKQAYDCQDAALPDSGFTYFQPLSGRFPGDSTHFHPNSHQGPYPNGHCNLTAPFHDQAFFEDVCYFHGEDQTAPPGGWYFGPHNLGHVGDSLVVWGRWLLQDVGFDAVRLDAVKHIEPGFMAPFLVELDNGAQPLAVGEFFDANMSVVKTWHDDVEAYNTTFGAGSKDANVAMFDFNLRYALRDMCNTTGGGFNLWDLNTRGLRLGVSMAADDVVTFVENHDVDRIGFVFTDASDPNGVPFGNSFIKPDTDGGHDPVVSDKHLAYAYIMAAEGRPMVFWKDWFWFGLEEEITWLMALRRFTATGASTPIASLNPFFDGGWHGGDLHVLRRDGGGGGTGALMVLNDRSGGSGTGGVWVDSPFANMRLKDYSDAFMFETRQVFADTRVNVRADSRNYAWYAPTGLYPQPPGETAGVFTLEAQPGGRLHFVALRLADAANFLVNGAPIAVGDQLAVLGPSGQDAAGLGRIGQGVAWDGVHDVIIEILGNDDGTNNFGRLKTGDPLDLAVYDASAGQTYVATLTTYAGSGTTFSFNPKRPASRGGSFNVTTNAKRGDTARSVTATASGAYQPGGISQMNAFVADQLLPVELVAFDAVADGNAAVLTWQTASETNNAGFEVQWTSQIQNPKTEIQNRAWEVLEFVAGAGTTLEAQSYSYRVEDLAVGAHRFRLKQIDFDGTFAYSSEVEVVIEMPDRFVVEGIFPNPFNREATLRFAVRDAQPVRVDLYDMLGRRVRTLYEGTPAAGSMQTVRLDGAEMPSGLYVVRLSGETFRSMQQVMLAK